MWPAFVPPQADIHQIIGTPDGFFIVFNKQPSFLIPKLLKCFEKPLVIVSVQSDAGFVQDVKLRRPGRLLFEMPGGYAAILHR